MGIKELETQMEQMMGMMHQLLQQAKSAGGGQREEESGGTGRGAANEDSGGAGRASQEKKKMLLAQELVLQQQQHDREEEKKSGGRRGATVRECHEGDSREDQMSQATPHDRKQQQCSLDEMRSSTADGPVGASAGSGTRDPHTTAATVELSGWLGSIEDGSSDSTEVQRRIGGAASNPSQQQAVMAEHKSCGQGAARTLPQQAVEEKKTRGRNNSSSSSGNDGGRTVKPQVPDGGASTSGVVAGDTPNEPVDRGKKIRSSDGTDRAVDRNTQLIYHWDRDPVVAQGRTRAEKRLLRDGIG